MFRRSRWLCYGARSTRNRKLSGNFTFHNVGHDKSDESAVDEARLSFATVEVVRDLAISENIVGEDGGGEWVEAWEEYVVVGVELVLGY